MITQLTDATLSDFVITASSRNDKSLVLTHPSAYNPENPLGSVIQFLALSGEKDGAIVDIEMRPPEHCQKEDGTPLLQTTVFVDVDLPDQQKLDSTSSSRQDRSR